MANAVPIARGQVEDILMLTPMQESMLFHYLQSEEALVYCEQAGLEMEGGLDIPAFYGAWKKLAEANEMLRTVIRWNDRHKAVQIIKREHDIPIDETDLSGVPEEDMPARLTALREARLNDRIDVSAAPIRILLCKRAADKYELLLDYHHMLIDGWSLGVILQEFLTGYHALKSGRPLVMQRKTPYKSYIKWLHEQDKSAQESYWRTYLAGLRQRSVIPPDRPKLADAPSAASVACAFGEPMTARMRRFCSERQLSMASLLYGAWGALLQKYNNTDDVCFGVTVSGRPPEIAGIEHMVGLFIQTLPLRLASAPNDTAVDYLRKAAADLSGKEAHASIPLLDLSAYSEMGGGTLLFDSVIVIKNYPLGRGSLAETDGLRVSKTYVHEETNFDLTLQVSLQESIHIDFHYNAQLYDAETIELLALRYRRMIDGFMERADLPMAGMELVTAEEKAEIGKLFHDTAADCPEQTIPQLIWRHSLQTPERAAVRYEDRLLTYGQLREQALRIAAMLRASGMREQERIALYVPRSPEMIAGVLGILEAGCICVPLDRNHPAERTLAILEDSRSAAMLVLDEADAAAGFGGTVLPIAPGRPAASASAEQAEAATPDASSPQSVAYMIYTSGSTGKPKGAMLHHRGIVNHAYAKIHELGIGASDKVGSNFSVNVVASIWQILSPLFAGAELVVYSEEVERDPLEQFARIEEDGVTVIELIPSVLNAYVRLLEQGQPVLPLTRLKAIALTSEETKPVLVNRFYSYYRIQLVNAYGQTECCDDTLHYRIPFATDTERVLIGRPVMNMRPYILDHHGMLQPLGMIGELCVAGAGVSYGYWNRPDMNRDKFIEHPLEPGVTMYRTGDLASWRQDGSIRYLGRVDHQVKIRGNRIELNEVENGMARLPEIREVAVIVRANARGEDALWAFFTAASALTVVVIREFLRKKLPSYMIPEQFVQLDQMPLMPNGKINRHALRETEAGALPAGNAAAVPEGELEERIMSIWEDVLHRDKLGVMDSFFDAGGNSLLILQLAAQLNNAFGVKLAVTDLFANATIRKQASFIRGMAHNEKMVQVPLRSIVIPHADEEAAASAELSVFEASMPAGVWPLLHKAGSQREFQASDIAVAALALLLNKLSGQDEIALYELHPDQARIKPLYFDFRAMEGVPALLAAYADQKAGNGGRWLAPESFLLQAQTPKSSLRPLVVICEEGGQAFADSSLPAMFNLLVEWRETGPEAAAVTWRLSGGGRFSKEQVKQWVSAHMKLTVYTAENRV